MNVDLYQLKREHKDFQDALDLLYILYAASRSKSLDMDKYPAALRLVWRHMCHIEERMSELLESEDDSGAATNETQNRD